MKKPLYYFQLIIAILIAAMISTQSLQAQQKLAYAYDAAGNRVSRTIVMSAPGVKSVQGKTEPQPSFYDTLDKKQVKLYPNPVNTVLTVEVSGFDEKSDGEYLLLDIQGKQLSKGRMKTSTFQVDMSAYSTGTYVLHLILNSEKTVWKIIKK